MRIAFASFRHGHITGLYQDAAAKPDVSIVGCYEANPQARKTMEDSLNISFTYQTYEELFGDPAVEVVAIGDYHAKRGGMVISALEKEIRRIPTLMNSADMLESQRQTLMIQKFADKQ